MSFREYLKNLRDNNLLIEINDKTDLELSITKQLQINKEKTTLFTDVKGSNYQLIGNLISSKDQLGWILETQNLYHNKFQGYVKNPKIPDKIESNPTFKNEITVNLFELPIPKFFSSDGGRYLTAGIVFAKFPNSEEVNGSIHRIMIIGKDKGVIRLVPRDLYKIHEENSKSGKDTSIAIIIGYHPAIALAISFQRPYGESELPLANALMNGTLKTSKTPKYGIEIPAETEFVFEGKISATERHNEGPFVDITGTKDTIRTQPTITIEKIYHRDNPIFQTILPANKEHFILMGFPREVQIYERVSKIVKQVHGIYLTVGGCGWLHAVISITPEKTRCTKNIGHAAFAAHPSLKWCTLVDRDIDIYNRKAVEWATITRAGKGDIIIINNVTGSSLDPSRNKTNNTTIKVIVDATKKGEQKNEEYERIIPF